MWGELMPFSSVDIIDKVESRSIKVFPATVFTDDISFKSKNFSNFLELAEMLEVRIAFIEITHLEEWEIVETLISKSEDEIGSIEWSIFENEIVAFNARIEEMRESIGSEQTIRLFFTCQGITYSISFVNDEVNPDSKEDFIEELRLKYENDIEDKWSKAAADYHEHTDKILAKFKAFILQDKNFWKCTNYDLRKAYMYKISENEEFELQSEIVVPVILRMSVVEEAWKEIKAAGLHK